MDYWLCRIYGFMENKVSEWMGVSVCVCVYVCAFVYV